MLTLDKLKHYRIITTMKRSQLAAVTGIAEPRLRDLELRKVEPWFDEALRLHRALGTQGVGSLLSVLDHPTASPFGSHSPVIEDAWRNGDRAPLSLAVHMAIVYGLNDCAELSVSPLLQQVWAVMASSERHPEAPGWCTWCAADIIGGDPHLPTCLANNLLTPHSQRIGDQVVTPLSLPRKRRVRGEGLRAPGLKALREESGHTQRQLADTIGVHSNHYARIERGDLPLSLEIADMLSAHYGVERSTLYAEPVA